MRTLQISLLGDFRLTYGDEVLTSVNTPRLQTLLAYLVLHRAAPVLRQYVAFQFWPDSTESQARTNLRKLFFQLQRALPAVDRLLVADPQTIGWDTQAPFTLDVAELQHALTQLNHDPLDFKALRQVGELYQGPLLPSCYDDWIAPLRQQLHEAVMEALERLLTLLENQRAYETGIRYARRLLAFDPLAEKTYQRLMRLHALQGDYNGALRVYQDCVAALRRELDVEPDVETQVLYRQLSQRDAVLVAKSAQHRPEAQLLPLIGRQPEWQRLLERWRRTTHGQSHFVCIWGEAGIGKTRLAEELLDWAGQQGILTARTRSYAAQGALSYAPITSLLRSPSLAPVLTRLPANWFSDVARLLPELREQQPHLAAPQPMSEGWQRQHFFEALGRAVLGDEQPRLLLFDDLHWCDGETLTWLRYLLTFAPHARLLIVGTSRVEEVDAAHPLTTLRLDLQRQALLTEIELTPLSAAEVTTLAAAVVDHALTVEQAQQLYADTEGNPLFVVETLRAGVQAKETGRQEDKETGDKETKATMDASSLAAAKLPPKVQAVIRTRLLQLSAQSQQIASLAAVIGRSFPFAVLHAAAHSDEETLINCLDELTMRRILREQGSESYDFSHDRIRDVAYAALSQARRRQLHRHVAEALETVYANQLDERSALLAEHWEQAGNRPKTAIYLQHAGEHAAAHYLHQEAIQYLSRALGLTPPEEQDKRCQLLLARERSHALQANRTAQKEDFAQLQAILAAWRGDRQAALRIGAEAAVRMSRCERSLANLPQSISYAQQAVELAQAGNAAQQQADGLLEWGSSLWTKADFAGARQQWTRVLETAEAANLPSRLAESLERLAQIEIFTGGSATLIRQYLERALANYEKDGNLIGKCNVLNKFGYLPMAQGVGDYRQARHSYEQALALTRKLGDRNNEGIVLRNLGILSVCEGDYAQAEHMLAAAHQLYEQTGAPDNLAVVLNCYGFAYLNQGQLARAQAMQERARQQLRQHKFGQWEVKAVTSLGWIHLLSNDTMSALAYADEGKRAALAMKDLRQAAYASACLGHVLIQLQEYPQATAAFQEAVAWHEQMQQANRRMEPLAGLAQVALLQGDLTQAQALVEEILSHLQSHTLDRTHEAFRVYLTCYHVLGAGDDARAQAMLHTAYEQLQTRAASILEPEAQRHFWAALPGHQEVQQAIVG